MKRDLKSCVAFSARSIQGNRKSAVRCFPQARAFLSQDRRLGGPRRRISSFCAPHTAAEEGPQPLLLLRTSATRRHPETLFTGLLPTVHC